MTSAAPAASFPRPDAPAVSPELDHLLDLPAPALEALYRGARVPNLAEISGDLRGRMLAVPALPESAARLPRALARSDRFPWRGKSFYPRSAERGEGINRVLLDRWKLYRFDTFVGRSRAGDFDAVQLDYDNPQNPFFIRPIKDEIRELSRGLYLGQAYLDVGAEPKLVLYFGLTSRPR